MTAKLFDRAGMNVTTIDAGGTVTTLALGSALGAVAPKIASYQDFGTAGTANGDPLRVLILGDAGAWEISTFTYSTAGPSLTNRTPQASSNGGNKIVLNGNEQAFIIAGALDITTAFNGRAGAVVPTAADYTAAMIGPNGSVYSVKQQHFSASGTYTPSAGMVHCIIEAWGGGGGSGGVAGQASVISAAGGGGAGSKSIKYATAAAIGVSQTVTIGAGGAAGANTPGAGGAGGDTSVGSLCIAKGGGGGGFGSGSASLAAGGAGGVAGTGDITGTGQPGSSGLFLPGTSAYIATGCGGSTEIGGGGLATGAVTAAAGTVGTGFGSGGGGGAVVNNGGAVTGGAGAPGFVKITEFCNQ